MQPNKANWFVRILIILLCIFIGGIIYINFFQANPPKQISKGIIILIAFLTVIVLSEAFDNFSIGKLMSISRKAKEKDIQNQELKRENSDLRSQIINITTTVSQRQVNSTFLLTDDLAKMLTVRPADDPEKEIKKREIEEVPSTQIQTRFISPGRFEEIALPKFLLQENLSQFPLVREAKFVNQFQQIDPISEYSPIFDGYIKTIDTEIFIEMKIKNRSVTSLRDRIYLMLSKINYYRTIKRVNAYLFLVLIIRPDQEYYPAMFEKIIQEFEPSIANGLLRISQVEITQDELKTIIESNN